MYEQSFGSTCVAAIGSMTQALAAQRVLNAEGFLTEVEAVDPTKTRRGCSYGVSFSCVYEKRIREILKRAGLRVRSAYEVDPK